MSTDTMNISLPKALKLFVKERSKKANYSNPSDYVRSLIREDQRRLAATSLLEEMVAKHLALNPSLSPTKLEKMRDDFWAGWMELKSEIDCGIASLEHTGGTELHTGTLANIKHRGRTRLKSAKVV